MNTEPRWQIHRRLAEDTDSRLDIVRQVPQNILLVGADADISRSLLAKRYPQAAFAEYDARPNFLQTAAQARKSGFWQKLTGKTIPQTCQNPTAPLPETSCDMLWANLSLICADEPLPVLQNWARALKPEGLLFFTHFGIDTLAELKTRLAAHNISCQTPTLIDMHDLGDMLFGNGFYDPVMDTAKLTLSYKKADTFWRDMETLGLWQAVKFSNQTVARNIINHIFAEEGHLDITLETVYGHAVKKPVSPQKANPTNEKIVQFFPKK